MGLPGDLPTPYLCSSYLLIQCGSIEVNIYFQFCHFFSSGERKKMLFANFCAGSLKLSRAEVWRERIDRNLRLRFCKYSIILNTQYSRAEEIGILNTNPKRAKTFWNISKIRRFCRSSPPYRATLALLSENDCTVHSCKTNIDIERLPLESLKASAVNHFY